MKEEPHGGPGSRSLGARNNATTGRANSAARNVARVSSPQVIGRFCRRQGTR